MTTMVVRRFVAGVAVVAAVVAGAATASAVPVQTTGHGADAGPTGGGQEGFEHFLTRDGNRVMDGDQQFRFLSTATPTLGLVEDNYSSPGADDFEWRLPDAFEIRDHLETVRRMGGQATRIYDISVLHPEDDPDLPRHIVDVPRDADGSLNEAAFDEEAFRTLDLVLATAAEEGVRVFIPITNQYPWHGGLAALSAQRGIDPGQDQQGFYGSRVLRDDYKAVVDYLTSRTNTITGVQYKDDPTIAAWAFGNEISNAPVDWLDEMSAHLKQRDPNHLTMQHNYQDSQLPWLLAETDIDIIGTSEYDNYSGRSPESIRAKARAIVPTKPYLAFEFGFADTATIEAVTDVLISEGATGGQLWGLRPHNRDGGFYWHGDEFGGSYSVRSYHFPGFDTGERYDERAVMDLLVDKAHEIRGIPVPAVEAPRAPAMLPVEHPSEISWQGSAGAESYVLERAEAASGPWTVLVDGITDDVVHSPIYNDRTAETGQTYVYRVTAQNAGGRSPASEPSAPVLVQTLAVTDDLVDLSQGVDVSDGVVIDDTNNRPLLERLSRAVRAPGAPPADPLTFDFEGDAATSGWNLPSWMAQNDGARGLRVVDDERPGVDHSLALPVRFDAGSGGQAGPEHRFADAPVDLRGRDTVTMSVHAPVAGLRANLVFNGPWNPGAERTLAVGWNELTFDVAAPSADFASVPAASTTWLVRIASSGLAAPFSGDVLVDDVVWSSSTYVPPVPGTEQPREQMTWQVDGNLRRLSLETFFEDEVEHFRVSTSSDGVTFTELDTDETVYGSDDDTYGYWQQVLYDAEQELTPDVRFVRVEFPGLVPTRTPQLDRAELEYLPYGTASLTELVDYYRSSADVSPAMAGRLDAAVDQAARHLEAGRTSQAAAALNRFATVASSTSAVRRGWVSAEASALLVHDAEAVIEGLRR